MSQVFAFNSRQIRTVAENNEIWFAAVDVCRALGLAWRINRLDVLPEQWKRSMQKFCMEGFPTRDLVFISEPAVYKLAFRSNKPEADAFTNWVASEVLPAIRKGGEYKAMPQQKAIEAAAESTLNAITLDAKTYATGKQFFDDVDKLRRNAEGIREALHFFARPGGRAAVLSSEKQMLYDNANEAANVAVTSLNQAIYALRMIYNIRAHVSFCR
ncbi:MAG: hypothetical protein HDR50_06715 [Desulfovibrio sp.]|uniref:BRO-N domain-containing protein n=1 Tax=Desulfovibrio sp. TaxID=885 RepID=UPI001A6CFF9F|nr:BRO family protein [Desulfovibrio sp.]MBD5417340.1 hypothetical protein [Desulfovibrio sp.]